MSDDRVAAITANFLGPVEEPQICKVCLESEKHMLVGYARVSTDDQNLNLQRDALDQAGCEQIFKDQLSGAKAERPGLHQALQYARTGDTIVVWRLDRLSRSLKDLIEMVTLLESKDRLEEPPGSHRHLIQLRQVDFPYIRCVG